MIKTIFILLLISNFAVANDCQEYLDYADKLLEKCEKADNTINAANFATMATVYMQRYQVCKSMKSSERDNLLKKSLENYQYMIKLFENIEKKQNELNIKEGK